MIDGLQEHYTDLLDALSLNPNPTTDLVQVQIDLPPGLVTGNMLLLTVVDAQGRPVLEERMAPPSQPHTLSLGGLGSGVYFVHMSDGPRWLAGARVVKE